MYCYAFRIAIVLEGDKDVKKDAKENYNSTTKIGRIAMWTGV
jgi:hypothetical protein